MKRLAAVVFASLAFAAGAVRAADAPPQTASGVALDAPWKVTIYAFARKNFVHPAWGWQHSERDHRLAVEIAHGDGLAVDTDVLFAAAMLHDMAAFKPWSQPKAEHGDVAAAVSEAVLRDAGFPMQKYAAVAAAERGHMYYSEAKLPEAVVLHDADSIDFLGTMGAVRILALTGAEKPDVGPALKTLRGFVTGIPPRLITRTARAMGAERAAELQRLLDRLAAESFGI